MRKLSRVIVEFAHKSADDVTARAVRFIPPTGDYSLALIREATRASRTEINTAIKKKEKIPATPRVKNFSRITLDAFVCPLRNGVSGRNDTIVKVYDSAHRRRDLLDASRRGERKRTERERERERERDRKKEERRNSSIVLENDVRRHPVARFN